MTSSLQKSAPGSRSEKLPLRNRSAPSCCRGEDRGMFRCNPIPPRHDRKNTSRTTLPAPHLLLPTLSFSWRVKLLRHLTLFSRQRLPLPPCAFSARHHQPRARGFNGHTALPCLQSRATTHVPRGAHHIRSLGTCPRRTTLKTGR